MRYMLSIAVTMLIGCQKSRVTGTWYQTSPQNRGELGNLVDHASLGTIQNLVSQGVIGARQLSRDNGTYEIYGPSYEELKSLLPGLPISSNEFIDVRDDVGIKENLVSNLPSSLAQLEIIHAYKAWQTSQGEGVSVAIVDTGLDRAHTSFGERSDAGPVLPGWNFAEDNGDTSDLTAHGTAVAGLIGAKAIGVAPKSRLIPLKVINSAFKIDEGTVIAALRYALREKIPLVHFSIGKPHVSQLFLELLKDMENQGTLLIAAAGNQGLPCEQFKQFPAAIDSPSIISVGATHLTPLNPFLFTSYSNFGDCVSIAAPGGSPKEGLFAPIWLEGQSLFRRVSGTSMSAPLVTGAAALLQSLHPDWRGPRLREEIILSAAKSEDLEGYVRSKGLLSINLKIQPVPSPFPLEDQSESLKARE